MKRVITPKAVGEVLSEATAKIKSSVPEGMSNFLVDEIDALHQQAADAIAAAMLCHLERSARQTMLYGIRHSELHNQIYILTTRLPHVSKPFKHPGAKELLVLDKSIADHWMSTASMLEDTLKQVCGCKNTKRKT